MEIGGYIEFERYNGSLLHEGALRLNCGRNALAYLIEARGIGRILMPKFMCDSCNEVLHRYGVQVRYYQVGTDLKPVDLSLQCDEWLYVVNFYGQLSNQYIMLLRDRYGKLIIDNAQAYFQEPVENVDTIYTCRKFFGVADGGELCTTARIERRLEHDESFERMHFLMGRFERSGAEFYREYVMNNRRFAGEQVKFMSKLTENLLRSLDYEHIQYVRTGNFAYLNDKLKDINKLKLTVPTGAFMYPFYVDNGDKLRKKLQENKVYIPMLWPCVVSRCSEKEQEYHLAKNIVPLPVDQRYGREEMNLMLEIILGEIQADE